jgi:ATP-dependent protease ClpP protease subunit
MMAFGAHAAQKEIILSADNTLVLDQAFSGESTVELMEKATKMDSSLKSGYPIYLFLYTPGGSIQAGLELFEFLAGLNRPVHTITLFAASMGFQTVQHLGTRYIVKYGVLMSHKGRGSFAGEFGGGYSQLDARYGLWLRRMQLMDEQTVKRTKGKQTLKTYTAAYTPELWLNGEEAVKEGYADEVVTVRCDQTLNTTRQVVEDYGFIRLILEFSNCPMKTYPVKVEVELATNKGFMKLKDFISKNGKFGDICFKEEKKEKNERESSNSYTSGYSFGIGYGSNSYKDDDEEEKKSTKKPEEPLCVQDKSITLDSINAKKDERVKWHTRNLRDHIVYSY